MYLPSYFLSCEATVAQCATLLPEDLHLHLSPEHVLGCPEVEKQIPGSSL